MKTKNIRKTLSSSIILGTVFLLTAVLAFTSCKDDEFYLKDAPTLDVSASNFTVPKDGGSISFEVYSNRKWVIADESSEANDPNSPWYKIIPESKSGENNAPVTVTLLPNNGSTRTLTLVIQTATLTEQVVISQAGSFVSEVIYTDDFGTTATQTGTAWPSVTEYTGWNKSGTGAANVTYSSEGGLVTVRNNAFSSGYTGASGACNVMMAAGGASFLINNINPGVMENMTVSFGSNETNTTLSLFYSVDGTTWNPISYEKTTTAWGLVQATFSIPAGSPKLNLKFTATTTQYGTRVDDVKLVGTGGSGGNSLTLSAYSLTPSTATGSFTVNVSSTTSWVVTPDAANTWCSVTPLSGSNNGTLTVSVTANTGNSRVATILVKSTDNLITRQLTVTQAGVGGGSNDGSHDKPYSVSEAMANQTASTTTFVWVKGYIVGTLESGSPSNVPNFDVPFTTQFNVFVAANPNETNAANCINVQLPAGTVRNDLNLNQHPENKGKEVLLEGTLNTYNTYPGLKNTRAYEWVSATGSTLSLSTPAENPTAAAGSITVNVTSNTSWNVTKDASATWCSINPTSGTNNGAFAITYSANSGGSRVATITVKTTDNAVTKTVVVTQAGATANDGTKEKPYTVAEGIANQGAAGNGVYKWVKGYVVGVVETSPSNAANFTTSTTVTTNILIAATATETNWDNCLNVQLPAGTVRNDLNLAAHPENKGKEVLLEGTLEPYFSRSGIRNTRAYEWVSAAGSTLTLSTQAENPTAAAGSITVNVTSNTGWNVTKDASATWCSVNPASGTNNGAFAITYLANTAGSRVATITVKTTDNAVTKTVVVTQQAGVTNTLTVSPSSLTMTAAGEEKTFTITSNTAWTVSVPSAATAWCSVNTANGSNNATITVTATANSGSARSTSITISGTGVADQTVFVSQQAAVTNTLTVSPSSLTMTAAGEAKTFTITSNTAWTVSVPSAATAWCSVNTANGSNNATITVTATANSGAERSTSITISGTGVADQTVFVSQDAASAGDQNLLLNGSFEDYTTATPANWTPTGSPTLTKITSGAKDGSLAVEIASSSGTVRLEQVVPDIVPNASYKVSIWYKNNTKGTATQGVRLWSNFRNAAGGPIAVDASSQGLQPTETFAAVGDTWTEYTVTVTAPADAASFNFGFRATNGYKGTVDNFTFVKQ